MSKDDWLSWQQWMNKMPHQNWQTILTTWIWHYLMNANRWCILVIYLFIQFSSIHSVFMVLACGFQCNQFSSVAQSCLTLCDPMDCSTPGLPVHHQLLEFAQTHVHWVGDATQPSHPLSSPSPPAFDHSQHHSLFLCVSSLHQVAKVLELQLQHQSFQWIFRTDFL